MKIIIRIICIESLKETISEKFETFQFHLVSCKNLVVDFRDTIKLQQKTEAAGILVNFY